MCARVKVRPVVKVCLDGVCLHLTCAEMLRDGS